MFLRSRHLIALEASEYECVVDLRQALFRRAAAKGVVANSSVGVSVLFGIRLIRSGD